MILELMPLMLLLKMMIMLIFLYMYLMTLLFCVASIVVDGFVVARERENKD